MSNNTILNAPTTSGDVIATIEVAGVKHQQVINEFSDGAGGVTQVSAANPMPISIVGVLAPLIPVFATRADMFTIAANGVTVNVSSSPVKYFAIQVTKTGAVTSWTVVLEGSLDGVTFTTILTHTDIIGDGEIVYIGTLTASCLYFRSRCTAISLGGGTSVTATILGTV